MIHLWTQKVLKLLPCPGVPGVCRRSKRSSGGATNVERRWHDWSEWGACRWDVDWLIQLHLRVLCVSEKSLMLQCCLWTWFKDEAPIRCGGGRIWGIVLVPGTRALESSLSFPVKESSAMAIERENMPCPNYVFHITCNTRWSAVTAKVTAATTTRTQMQLSRKLMRPLYRSSPGEFSESLWTNWIVLSNSYISLQQYCGSRKPEKNLLWGSKVLLSIGNIPLDHK